MSDARIIKHESVPQTGSYEVRFADGRPSAYHYFDVEGQKKTVLDDVENRNKPGGCCGATVSYDPSADADAHRRVETFFGRHLGR